MNSPAVDTAKQSREMLMAELERAGVHFRGNNCKCPFHDDRSPSANIYEHDGIWRFKCHGCGFGGDIFDVIAKTTQRDVADVLKDFVAEQSPRPLRAPQLARRPEPPMPTYDTIEQYAERLPGKVESIYRYTDPASGKVDLYVVRFRDEDGKKSFRQAHHRASDGKIIAKGIEGRKWPIYNRSRIAAATPFEPIIVAEGEKAVHALQHFGIVATTSPGGAGKAAMADWSPLAGKRVYLWADNDLPENGFPHGKGVAHMRAVAQILEGLTPPPAVYWIDVAALELPPKGDAVEYLERYKTWSPDDIRQMAIGDVLEAAKPMGAAGNVRDDIEQTIAGNRRSIAFPWPVMSTFTQALAPGTITLLCGDPGSTKSLMLLEAAAHWQHNEKLKIAIYELEEDKTYHLKRAIAQLYGESQFTNRTWIEANPAEARNIADLTHDFAASFARSLYESPDAMLTLPELAEWIEARAADGCKIIAVDPVTMVTPATRTPWNEDLHFMHAVQRTVRKYMTRVILVTHPSKRKNGTVSLDDLAGGAAYQRFAQTIIWLKAHKTPVEARINYSLGSSTKEINRSLHIMKARNGTGAGCEIGFVFDPKTLRFNELGEVLED